MDKNALTINFDQRQSLKQNQLMIMSHEMQQALRILQTPLMELIPIIESEIENNPILEHIDNTPDEDIPLSEEISTSDIPPEQEIEFNDSDYRIIEQLSENFYDFSYDNPTISKSKEDQQDFYNYLENSITSNSSLFETVMRQAHETLEESQDLAAAEIIAGNLDEDGFLDTSISELALLNGLSERALERALEKIKTFKPYGLGGKNLQESLLIQLECRHQKDSLAYHIISDHYDELLSNKLPLISKKLKISISSIQDTIKNIISHLDLHPGLACYQQNTPYLTADIYIEEQDDGFTITVDDESLPPIRLKPQYLDMVQKDDIPQKIKSYIKKKISSGQWLLKTIQQRHQTLYRVAQILLEQQESFFRNNTGKLKPLTMQSVAKELELHESTIARAVANKYLYCSRGLIPLRSFFTNGYITSKGSQFSSTTVKDMISKIISEENKAHPLSDQAISNILHDKGLKCARRTVTKYRIELNIADTRQRKVYCIKR